MRILSDIPLAFSRQTGAQSVLVGGAGAADPERAMLIHATSLSVDRRSASESRLASAICVSPSASAGCRARKSESRAISSRKGD
jgi:hypothetical protein